MTAGGLGPRLAAAAADLAFKDDLTGLFNRRFLNLVLAEWWQELAAEHQRMALLMLDLDGFKEVNDTLGHLAGDSVLKRTAEVLRRTFRGGDVLVRFGGDEFVVLLPGAGQAEADRLGRRAREAMAGIGLDEAAAGSPGASAVSFSLGVAVYPEDGASGEAILARADERLYADKRRRRPRVRAAAPARRRALVLLALGGALAIALAVARTWLLPGTPPAVVAVPVAATRSVPLVPGPSARELALLEEIDRLRRELAQREARTASEAAGQPAIRELRSRIEELEGQLDAERGRPPEPPPAATAMPGESSSPVLAEPTASAPPESPTPLSGGEATAPVEILPRLLSHEAPVYPERARQFRRQAVVELRVTVDEAGRVVRVRPVGTPIGLGFEEAARRAAFTARYVPGRRNGVPAVMETTLTVVFRLDASSS
ncbi:MAG TPA: TonB family protein [Thermoanaerobaculaceae bacterium]|nr:TonB family protein [Thermoanaerobaculaceae bacterium]HRS17615.1 TonB family protein [Thermoanaerobaculaceae bacterium]